MCSAIKESADLGSRDRRREQRALETRRVILDAAERVAGSRGLTASSVREIAAEAGFSPAAIYLYFDSREHLLAEVMIRRGADLVGILEQTANGPGNPLARLHLVVDRTVEFFGERPAFRLLLSQVNPDRAPGPALKAFTTDPHAHFTTAMSLLADLISQGQRKREIRAGNPAALARLFSVLVNEHVFMTGGDEDQLTAAEFHDLVDGALRPGR